MNKDWKLFNFLVRRVLAVGFIVVGTILAASAAPSLLPGGVTYVDGAPTEDIVFRLAVFLLPLMCAGFGVALFKAKPFDPPWR